MKLKIVKVILSTPKPKLKNPDLSKLMSVKKVHRIRHLKIQIILRMTLKNLQELSRTRAAKIPRESPMLEAHF